MMFSARWPALNGEAPTDEGLPVAGDDGHGDARCPRIGAQN
jgi:hypothetical protein